MSYRNPNQIASEFNKTARKLILKFEQKSRSELEIANLDRLKKRITLLLQTMGNEALINEAAPFFIVYCDKIIDREEEFFNTMDVKEEFKRNNKQFTKSDQFILSLVDSIRAHYNSATSSEQDDAYSDVKKMLECCLEYKIVKK